MSELLIQPPLPFDQEALIDNAKYLYYKILHELPSQNQDLIAELGRTAWLLMDNQHNNHLKH